MQLTKHIGCLLALVFATASAFAEVANGSQWFTAPVDASLTGWEVNGTWEWKTTYGSFKGQLDDANTELVYAPDSAGTDMDETVCTKVKFTAMDIADAQVLEVPSGAKAGLTLVEDENGALAYWGVVNTNSEGVLGWVPLSGANLLSGKSSSELAEVEVKVALFKDGENVYANYTIAGEALKYNNSANIPLTATEPVIASIAYRGMCDLWNLSGLAWSNDPTVPSEVEISDEGCPTTPIAYNHQDLKLLIGDDADDEEKVATYFKTKQNNGLKGWVNYALGLDGTDADDKINVQSNKCVEGSVALDFGFVVAEGHEVLYKIDADTKGTKNAEVAETTGIHTVKIVVDGVEVDSKDVGVMNTGKNLTDLPSTVEKTYDIIAVPFAGFGGQVTVATLLNTAELTDGDTLYVLRDNQYNSYQWDADNGCWKSLDGKSYTRGGSATKKATTAEEETLNPGEAVWLEHAKTSKIVIAGVGETDQDHKVTVKKGEYNLIANPTINGFDLASAVGAEKDMIIVEDVADPVQYEYNGSVWGKWVTQASNVKDRRGNWIMETVFVPAGDGTGNTAKCIIPAGIGFWYKSAGTADIEIDFGKNIAK